MADIVDEKVVEALKKEDPPAQGSEGAPKVEGAPAEEVGVDIEALKQEAATWKEHAHKAAADAQAAQNYVQNLMASLASREQQQPASNWQEQFNEDPIRFTDQMVDAKMAPLRREYVENQTALNYQLAEQRARSGGQGEEWDTYKGELAQFMKTVSPENAAKPGAVDAAFKFVLSNHIDDILKNRIAKQSQRDQQVVLATPSGAPAPGKEVQSLTQEELNVANGLGMKPEEYLKWKNV